MYLILLDEFEELKEAYEVDELLTAVEVSSNYSYAVITESKVDVVDIFSYIEEFKADEESSIVSSLCKDKKNCVIFECSSLKYLIKWKLYCYGGKYIDLVNLIGSELESKLQKKERFKIVLNNPCLQKWIRGHVVYPCPSKTLTAKDLLQCIGFILDVKHYVVKIYPFFVRNFAFSLTRTYSADVLADISSIEELLRFFERVILDNEDEIIEKLEEKASECKN